MKTTEKPAESKGKFEDGGLRVPEAIRQYGIGRTLLYQLMNEGKLPFSQLTPRLRIIPKASLIELLQKNEVAV